MKAGEQLLRGEYFLVATGASPSVPPIPGLDTVQYLTSTTAFALKKLPSSMIIIGGRYIALEVAQMFQRLGCRVTILQRSERILRAILRYVSRPLTKQMGCPVIAYRAAGKPHAENATKKITTPQRRNTS